MPLPCSVEVGQEQGSCFCRHLQIGTSPLCGQYCPCLRTPAKPATSPPKSVPSLRHDVIAGACLCLPCSLSLAIIARCPSPCARPNVNSLPTHTTTAMPLFRKSETSSEIPEIREVEKRVAKEAHADQKNFDHAITDLSHADKTHNKSIKVSTCFPANSRSHSPRAHLVFLLQAADKAQLALDKAAEQEHKAVKTLNRAAHKHDAALSNEQNAEKIVQVRSSSHPAISHARSPKPAADQETARGPPRARPRAEAAAS